VTLDRLDRPQAMPRSQTTQLPKRNVSKANVEAAILDKPASVSQLMARRRRNNSRNFWFWIICADWFISTVLTLLVWFLELCW
jgi:hypothetical protein